MEQKGLTPWVVPKWVVRGFYNQVAAVSDFGYSIVELMNHDATHYLVLTTGYRKETHDELEEYLAKVWE